MSRPGQCPSSPLPNGAYWRKISPGRYEDTSGRFTLEAEWSPTCGTKVDCWVVWDAKGRRTSRSLSLRSAKSRVQRTLFDEGSK